MRDVVADGFEVDYTSVYGHLLERGDKGLADTCFALISDLDRGYPRLMIEGVELDNCARRLRRKTQQRRLYRTAQTLSGETLLQVEQPEVLIRSALDNLAEIRGMDETAHSETIGEFISNRPGGLTAFLKPPKGTISLHLSDLQHKTRGLKPGELWLLAARPSMGKTALALNIGLNATRHGRRVGMFSLEMSKEPIGARLLSYIASANLQDLMDGAMSLMEKDNLEHANAELRATPFYIFDDQVKTVHQIRRQTESGKFELAIIDYLQLLSEPGRWDNRNAEVSAISRGLKVMARELHIPILVLSQLSRATEGRPGCRPQLSDLRDSGSLEQDADVVVFIYRQAYYKRNEPGLEREAELIVAKQRNGPTGDISVRFIREFGMFCDLEAK